MFSAFHVAFPKIGVSESRSITPFTEDGPVGTYLFLELYCDEPGCDCRRVIVRVVTDEGTGAPRLVASLSFGWESEAFYRRWAGYPLDEDDLAELKGPGLQRLAPQTERADEMLGHFRTLLADPAYVARIKRHYALFRARVESGALEQAPAGMNRSQRRARRRRTSSQLDVGR